MIIDIYFIKIHYHKYINYHYDYYHYFIFDNEDYLKLNENEISLNVHLGNENGKAQIELTNTFSIYNSFNSGKIINDIKLKYRKLEKGSTFSIIDAEIFSLIGKKKEK